MIKYSIFRPLLFLWLLFFSVFANSQTGIIEGRIIDMETQDPLSGASVFLEGTTIGAMADMDGYFTIAKIPPGQYNILGSYISYETQTMPDVIVREGEVQKIDLALAINENVLDAVGIVARVNRESEVALLLDRRNAIASTQSIGAAELSRKGISDAQAAVSSVSGISKQEGVKNIFVRGLGDRYNTTLLNGLPIPSEDPEYKNIALSIFDSDIIKNIGVEKVFTAYNSGDAGGAIIDIVSKELANNQAFDLSISNSLNSNTAGKTFFTPDGSNYFGFANSYQPDTQNFDFANRLDPLIVSPDGNYSYRISGGKRFDLGKNSLSFFAVARHATDHLFTSERVQNIITDGTVYQDQLGEKYETKISQLVLARIHYDINNTHSLDYNFMALHSTNQYVGDYLGKHSEKFQDAFNDFGFYRRQQINDNLLLTHQLLSKWKLNERFQLNSGFSINNIKGLEPDRRENYLSQKENGSFGLTGSNRQKRFFSALDEQDFNVKFVLNYTLKDDVENGKSNFLLGYQGRFSANNFESVEYNFSAIPKDITIDNLQLDDLYNSDNFRKGLFSMTKGRPNSFEVAKNNHAVFSETNYKFSNKLSGNFGLRMDLVDMDISFDVPGQKGRNTISSPYFLPSFNIKYDLNSENSFRFGASKTYTLPQSKEISPFQYVNISFASEGNANLKPSDNYNIDFRWDNYLSNSELLSGTIFYKHILNPIGRVDKGNSAGLLTYDNISNSASVAGIELELRKHILNQSNTELGSEKKLTFGLNSSYIITSSRLKLTNTPERESGLEGASPLLVHTDLTYHYSRNGAAWITSAVFNYFSSRIHTLGTMGYSDIMEEGTSGLDITSSYQFSKNFGISLKAGNLLNSPIELTRKVSGSGEKITLNRFERGINFSLGLSYSI